MSVARTHDGLRILLLGFALLLAFALRIAGLGAQSLWYDEGFSVYLARQSLGSITSLTAGDIHPPFYYYLLHFWILGAGDSEFSLRLLSLMPGVLLIPVLVRLATGYVGHWAGVMVAFVAAASPPAVWYSQEARMYSLLAFFVALSLDRMLVVLTQKGGAQGRAWLAWVASGILAGYTHFYGLFAIASEAVACVAVFAASLAGVFPSGRRVARQVYGDATTEAMKTDGSKSGSFSMTPVLHLLPKLALGFFVTAVAFLPWLTPAMIRLDADESYYAGEFDVVPALRETVLAITVGQTLEGALAWTGAIATCLLIIVGVLRFRRQPVHLVFLLSLLVVPVVLLVGVSWSRPKFHPRYLFLILPVALVLLTAGFEWGVTRLAAFRRASFVPRLLVCFLAGLVTVAWAQSLRGLYWDSRVARDDWRGVVAALPRSGDDSVILISGHAFPVFTYYYGDRPYTPVPDGFTLSTRNTLGYNIANTLNAIAERSKNVWIVRWQDNVVDPNGFLNRLLIAGADRENVAAAPHGVGLERYRFRPGAVFRVDPNIEHRLDIDFAGKLRLLGFDGESGESVGSSLNVPAGEQVNLTLYWLAGASLPADYKVAIRLVDELGNVWGRVDQRPAAYFYPTSRWKPGEIVFGDVRLPLQPATPPGRYRIELEAYAETATGLSPLDVLDRLGNPAGQSAAVAQLTVGASKSAQSRVAIPVPNKAHVGPLSLEGTDAMVANDLLRPGDSVTVGTYWRLDRKLDRAVQLRWRLVDSSGKALSELLQEPAGVGWPTTLWPEASTWRGLTRFRIPADAVAGPSELRVSADGSDEVVVTRLTIQPADRSFRLPDKIQHPLDIVVGDFAALRGFDLSRESARSGEKVDVTLFWQARQTTSADLKVFVHLLDSAGRVIAQRDSVPLAGRAPTTSWIAGQVIADTYTVVVPPNQSGGLASVEIGLYEPVSGKRVVVGNDDHLILGTITIQ